MDKRRSTESEENGECSVREEIQSEEQSPKDVEERSEISKPNPRKDDEFLMTAARSADTGQLNSTSMLPEEVQVSYQSNIISENFLPISTESSDLPVGEGQSINKAQGKGVTNDQSLLTKEHVTKTTENALQNSSGSEVLHSSPYKPHRETKEEKPPGQLKSPEVALDRNSNIQSSEASCSWMVRTPEKDLKGGTDSPWIRGIPDPPKKSDKSREISIDVEKLKISKRKLWQKYALPPTPDNSDDEIHIAASESTKRFVQLKYPSYVPARDDFPNTSDKIRGSNSQFISSGPVTDANSSEVKGNTGCSEEINKRSEKRKRQPYLDTEDENESEESKAIKSPTISSSPTSSVDVMKSSSSSAVSCQKAFNDRTTPKTSENKEADSFETPLSSKSSRIPSRRQRSLSAPEAESPSKCESEGIKKLKVSENSSEEGSNRSSKIFLSQEGSVTPKCIQRKKISLPCRSLPGTPSRISTKQSSVLRRKDMEKIKCFSSERLSAHFGQQRWEKRLSITFPLPTQNQSSSVNIPTQRTNWEAGEAQGDAKQSGNSYTLFKRPIASDSPRHIQPGKNPCIIKLQTLKLCSPVFLKRRNSSSTQTKIPSDFLKDQKTSGDEIAAVESSARASFEKETADGQSIVGEDGSEDDREANENSVITLYRHRTGDVRSVTQKCRNRGDARYGESSQVMEHRMDFEHGMTKDESAVAKNKKQDALTERNVSAVTSFYLEIANPESDIAKSRSQDNISSENSGKASVNARTIGVHSEIDKDKNQFHLAQRKNSDVFRDANS